VIRIETVILQLTWNIEYWAGSLEIHSLEGYGVDAFLQISKLGNKNERLTTRASMDAI
jgi:pyruvate dehydrogenase kinase 2/3/4